MNGIDKARLHIEDRIYRDAIGDKPDSTWKVLMALVGEKGFATRVIRKHLHLPTPLNTTDRAVLEQRVFPYYSSNPSIRDVLFVGCNTYTAHYQRDFFPDVNFVTLEPDPELARYGASCHIQAPLEKLADHCPPGSFDLIICNGVFGWGLNTYEQCETAFSQCHQCLVQDGQMVLGWDDLPQRTPIALERLPSLRRFRKYAFPAFRAWRYRTDTPFRHTYDFYRK
ncbi:MAG TPA: class I SAM-dependent methyltransferase [Steroidobacteraceae bacterium]